MINRLGDSIIRQAIEQIAETTQQTQPEPAQELEPSSRQIDSSTYGSSLISEQRFAGSAQEAMLRSALDQQFASQTAAATGTPGVQSTGSASSIQRELAFGSQGEDVKTLQTELNKWLAEVNYPQLPVTGYFGTQTQEALKFYQEATDIKVDGIFGPVTRDNLTLNNDPNFKKLDFNQQQAIKVRMSGYENDPDRRRALLNAVTDPNFHACDSPRTRQAILNRIDYGPITPENEANWKGYLELRADMAKDPNFKSLTPETQELIDMRMEQSYDYQTQAKIHGIATDAAFGKLTPAHQREAMNAFDFSVRLGGGDSYNAFMEIIRNPSLPQMNTDVQTRIFDAVQRNGMDAQAVKNLAALTGNPQFAAMSPGQQKGALDVYLMMHPGVEITG